jgi:hypothetical protein
MLVQHFEDHKEPLSKILAKGIMRLTAIVDGSKDKAAVRDAKKLLDRRRENV